LRTHNDNSAISRHMHCILKCSPNLTFSHSTRRRTQASSDSVNHVCIRQTVAQQRLSNVQRCRAIVSNYCNSCNSTGFLLHLKVLIMQPDLSRRCQLRRSCIVQYARSTPQPTTVQRFAIHQRGSHAPTRGSWQRLWNLWDAATLDMIPAGENKEAQLTIWHRHACISSCIISGVL
jgi:hypothetical protein